MTTTPSAASLTVPFRRWPRRILLAMLALAIIYGAAKAIAPHFDGMANVVDAADWRILSVVGAASVAYRWANAAAWGSVLSALGRRIGSFQAARMWLLSEACRWLPGSIWNYGSRVGIGMRAGIPANTLGAAIGLELALTVGSWALVGVVAAILSGMYLRYNFDFAIILIACVSIALVLAAVSLAPGMRRRLNNKITSVLNRLKMLGQLSFDHKGAFKIFLAYVALNFFSGIVCWALICGLSPGHEISFFAVVGANAIAWLVGFFAVFAPAGLGVREGAFVLLLSPYIPWETCAVAASFWRLIQIAAEFICIGLASAFSSKEKCTEQQLEKTISVNGDPSPVEAPAVRVFETSY